MINQGRRVVNQRRRVVNPENDPPRVPPGTPNSSNVDRPYLPPEPEILAAKIENLKRMVKPGTLQELSHRLTAGGSAGRAEFPGRRRRRVLGMRRMDRRSGNGGLSRGVKGEYGVDVTPKPTPPRIALGGDFPSEDKFLLPLSLGIVIRDRRI
ncbi:hypothetical protein B0H14DRAFT_2594055 [Mycena olivaceomarginata]|nr:hypothetical protein B0H14DRAFT_2594055 [Mycena olivaceomarginata]